VCVLKLNKIKLNVYKIRLMPWQQYPQKEKRPLFYCYVDEPTQQGSGEGVLRQDGRSRTPGTYVHWEKYSIELLDK